jgi:hypothetical protein
VRLLLDEMYAPAIARALRERGHDVISVKERPELVEVADAELLERMAVEGRAIVTNDPAGFLPLMALAARQDRHHAGLWLTSDRSMPRHRDTIGTFVEVLDRQLRELIEEPVDQDRVRWVPGSDQGTADPEA